MTYSYSGVAFVGAFVLLLLIFGACLIFVAMNPAPAAEETTTRQPTLTLTEALALSQGN
ncbi:MAG: hypothetical protein V1826_00755 [bacterium]